MSTPTSHGVPVVSARQWTTALSPNAAGNDWNYIACSWVGPNPVEWVVLKNITATPTKTIYQTPDRTYPNTLRSYTNQLRAPNGRIFFMCFGLYTAYYDPVDEQVHQLGPVVETPAIDQNASTIFYSASFDTAGLLYFATQESQERPSCIVVTDPDTLTQTILGYVGAGAQTYTTYGYSVAPDTANPTKYVYVAFGENPWQLWALNITPGADFGTATKLFEVPSTGHISFLDISGQGWVADIHSDLGKSDDVHTQLWCLDGVTYPYTTGQPAPDDPNNPGHTLARSVTPASNPLVSAPSLDTTGGVGVVGWRANGSNGAYTYVDYTVNYDSPTAIEALVATPDGVLGSAENYLGFFRYVKSTDVLTWFGAQSGAAQVAQPLTLYVSSLNKSFVAGYPDGVLLEYNPTAAWQTFPTVVNPSNPGYYGPSGNQLAGIKYAGNPATPTTIGTLGNLVWSSVAGTGGRLYCAGTRDRSGMGGGIGYWDKATSTFAGTYASPLDTVQPQGLVALDSLGKIVMSTNMLSGTGTAPLLVFDHDLNLVAQNTVIAGRSNLGQVVPTSNANVVCGIVQGSNNSLALWQYNVQTSTFITYVELSITGTVGCGTLRSLDGSYWLMCGNNLVRVSPDGMSGTVIQDLTSVAPVSVMAFDGTGTTLYVAGGSDGKFSQIFSLDFPVTHTAGPPAHGTIRSIIGRGLIRPNQGRATIKTSG